LDTFDARSHTILWDSDQDFFWRSFTASFLCVYGEHNALISIELLEVIEGDLPNRAEKLVIEWATLYQRELLNMWNSQEFCKLPPLK